MKNDDHYHNIVMMIGDNDSGGMNDNQWIVMMNDNNDSGDLFG